MSKANAEVSLSDLKPGDKIYADVTAKPEDIYVPPDKPKSTITKRLVVAVARTVIMTTYAPLSMLAGKPTRQICVVLSTAEDHVEVAYTGTLGGVQTFPDDALDESMWYQLQPGEEIGGPAAALGKTVWVNLRKKYRINDEKV